MRLKLLNLRHGVQHYSDKHQLSGSTLQPQKHIN